MKTVLSAVGLLFAKVGLLFGVMFISWVGNISDSIVKPVDSASSMLNSVLYLFLMYLLWKNKRWLVEAVTGSSVANSALNKISLTRTGRKMLNTAGQMNRDVQGVYRGARDTLKKVSSGTKIIKTSIVMNLMMMNYVKRYKTKKILNVVKHVKVI